MFTLVYLDAEFLTLPRGGTSRKLRTPAEYSFPCIPFLRHPGRFPVTLRSLPNSAAEVCLDHIRYFILPFIKTPRLQNLYSIYSAV